MTPPTFLPSYHDAVSVSELQYRQVGKTDMLVSALSFGASSLGGVFRQTDDAESGEKREEREACQDSWLARLGNQHN